MNISIDSRVLPFLEPIDTPTRNADHNPSKWPIRRILHTLTPIKKRRNIIEKVKMPIMSAIDKPKPVLILASRSPRRAMMLQREGYRFKQVDPLYNDPPQPEAPDHSDPCSHAITLAGRKAVSLQSQCVPGTVIIAADTICVAADGRLIGQPADQDDARRMIRQFMNADHEVVTGIALLHSGVTSIENGDSPQLDCFADRAVVQFGQLADDLLEAYLDSGHWRGKAGGYNLFDRQEAGWPVDVLGDPDTVVGLPMRMLRQRLTDLGIVAIQNR